MVLENIDTMLRRVARDLLRMQDTSQIGSRGIASGLDRPLLEENFLLEQAQEAEEAGEPSLYPPLDGERKRIEEGPAEKEREEALWMGVEQEAAVGAASVAKSEAFLAHPWMGVEQEAAVGAAFVAKSEALLAYPIEWQIEKRSNLPPDPALMNVKEV